MVILLDGASALVRSTIALQAIKRNPTWQHLALESMQGASGTTKERALHLSLIRKCVKELDDQQLHLLFTLPGESDRYMDIAAALAPDCITVHLGNDEDGDYDHALPLSTTLPDVLALFDTLMNIPA